MDKAVYVRRGTDGFVRPFYSGGGTATINVALKTTTEYDPLIHNRLPLTLEPQTNRFLYTDEQKPETGARGFVCEVVGQPGWYYIQGNFDGYVDALGKLNPTTLEYEYLSSIGTIRYELTSPNGDYLYSNPSSSVLTVYDTVALTSSTPINVGTSTLTCIDVNKVTGHIAVSTSSAIDTKFIAIVNEGTWDVAAWLPITNARANTLAFSDDGNYLFVGQFNNFAVVDSSDPDPLNWAVLSTGNVGGRNYAHITPDGTKIIIDPTSGQPAVSYNFPSMTVYASELNSAQIIFGSSYKRVLAITTIPNALAIVEITTGAASVVVFDSTTLAILWRGVYNSQLWTGADTLTTTRSRCLVTPEKLFVNLSFSDTVYINGYTDTPPLWWYTDPLLPNTACIQYQDKFALIPRTIYEPSHVYDTNGTILDSDTPISNPLGTFSTIQDLDHIFFHRYSSDGRYMMARQSLNTSDHTIQVYDLEERVWLSLPTEFSTAIGTTASSINPLRMSVDNSSMVLFRSNVIYKYDMGLGTASQVSITPAGTLSFIGFTDNNEVMVCRDAGLITFYSTADGQPVPIISGAPSSYASSTFNGSVVSGDLLQLTASVTIDSILTRLITVVQEPSGIDLLPHASTTTTMTTYGDILGEQYLPYPGATARRGGQQLDTLSMYTTDTGDYWLDVRPPLSNDLMVTAYRQVYDQSSGSNQMYRVPSAIALESPTNQPTMKTNHAYRYGMVLGDSSVFGDNIQRHKPYPVDQNTFAPMGLILGVDYYVRSLAVVDIKRSANIIKTNRFRLYGGVIIDGNNDVALVDDLGIPTPSDVMVYENNYLAFYRRGYMYSASVDLNNTKVLHKTRRTPQVPVPTKTRLVHGSTTITNDPICHYENDEFVRFIIPTASTSANTDVVISGDGSKVIIRYRALIYRYDVINKTLLPVYTRLQHPTLTSDSARNSAVSLPTMTASYDGKYVAYQHTFYNNLIVLDMDTGLQAAELQAPENFSRSLVFLADRLIAVGGAAWQVGTWELTSFSDDTTINTIMTNCFSAIQQNGKLYITRQKFETPDLPSLHSIDLLTGAVVALSDSYSVVPIRGTAYDSIGNTVGSAEVVLSQERRTSKLIRCAVSSTGMYVYLQSGGLRVIVDTENPDTYANAAMTEYNVNALNDATALWSDDDKLVVVAVDGSYEIFDHALNLLFQTFGAHHNFTATETVDVGVYGTQPLIISTSLASGADFVSATSILTSLGATVSTRNLSSSSVFSQVSTSTTMSSIVVALPPDNSAAKVK